MGEIVKVRYQEMCFTGCDSLYSLYCKLSLWVATCLRVPLSFKNMYVTTPSTVDSTGLQIKGQSESQSRLGFVSTNEARTGQPLLQKATARQ
jgi:hypothetical protein